VRLTRGRRIVALLDAAPYFSHGDVRCQECSRMLQHPLSTVHIPSFRECNWSYGLIACLHCIFTSIPGTETGRNLQYFFRRPVLFLRDNNFNIYGSNRYLVISTFTNLTPFYRPYLSGCFIPLRHKQSVSTVLSPFSNIHVIRFKTKPNHTISQCSSD
jgi:hypothetical protein